ncbi:adenylate/guanylate cyclase domain-containing protein [Gordonia sp. TBRC 11910]|uniref:Adenylate/guanylate cyclase domain-containing protein n=1 Tax=Gordonia asplenii TaxID=2725283 RepID=A0A848L4V1_9ACTN|nr:adenylate/guanylate cyclase domain-containing protein [Gordonia asplenii]NMO03601.1 adenylate/guanylate cyclase domain-containing protein [Gordonia asplenii]
MARLSWDYGSVLLGSASDRGVKQRIRIQVLITSLIFLASSIGAVIAVVLAWVGIPEPSVFQARLWWINFIAVPLYVTFALSVGVLWGTIVVVRDLKWSIRDTKPTPRDVRKTRRAPWKLIVIQGILWSGAAVLGSVAYGVYDPRLIPKIMLVVLFSGAVVVGISYLLVDFAMRPVLADVIKAGYSGRKRAGLRTRAFMSWLVGSGIPLTGILLVSLFMVLFDAVDRWSYVIAVTVIASIAIATGMLLTYLNTIGITGPVRSVQHGMNRVRGGDTDVDVVVYDGTELGDLQVGFNTMVRGLRERERIRDLFGRHVGHDVAEAALASNPELGGAERVVATIFVDVIGSTTLAAEHPPTEVVTILNRFFAVIVHEVEQQRGLVNKFEGDAVLAIFGAPISLDDPAGSALAAARQIAVRLAVEVPEISAGIGVGYGPVVAGNVGAIERFEYTVIGDPVNESARLSELAKRDPRRPVASARTIDAASSSETVHWEQQDTITLRGRTEGTTVYAAVV